MIKILIILIISFTLLRCSSGPEVSHSDVLSDAEHIPDPTEAAAPNNPKLVRLNELLRGLGYEGLGLQFEKDSILELLFDIFSSPRAHGREIKLVYTGIQLAYDAKHQSVTIGGTSDKEIILGFIEKTISKRQEAPVVIVPTPQPSSPPTLLERSLPYSTPSPTPGLLPTPTPPGVRPSPSVLPLQPSESSPNTKSIPGDNTDFNGVERQQLEPAPINDTSSEISPPALVATPVPAQPKEGPPPLLEESPIQ